MSRLCRAELYKSAHGKIIRREEVVRLKAILLDPDSATNAEGRATRSQRRRREARYYFDLHDLDGGGDMEAARWQTKLVYCGRRVTSVFCVSMGFVGLCGLE